MRLPQLREKYKNIRENQNNSKEGDTKKSAFKSKISPSDVHATVATNNHYPPHFASQFGNGAELDPTHLMNNPYDLNFDLTPYM